MNSSVRATAPGMPGTMAVFEQEPSHAETSNLTVHTGYKLTRNTQPKSGLNY